MHIYIKSSGYISALLLSFALVFIPLPEAGVTGWAAFVFNFLVMAALFFYIAGDWHSINRTRFKSIYLPWLVVLLVLTGWIFIQLFVLPSILGWKLYLPLDTHGPDITPGPINMQESLHYWAMFCGYWILAFIVTRLTVRQCKLLFWTLSISFVFQIVYGLMAFFEEYTTILGIWSRTRYKGLATGTFINHNHYAGFLAVCWPMFLSFFSLSRRHGGANVPDIVKWIAIIFISMLCLIALIVSQSRMGLAVGLFGISVWLWGFAGKQLQLTKSYRLVMIACLWVLLLLVGAWYGLGEIIERVLRLWIVETRWEIWENSLQLSKYTWIWGAGAGGFADVYMPVHSPVAIFFTNEAHNDYLQFIIEFGIVGSVLMLCSGIYWIVKCLPRYFSLLRWGAICAVVVIGLHSLIDFNLQIPGVAAYFWFAVGCMMNPHLFVDHKKRNFSIDEFLPQSQA